MLTFIDRMNTEFQRNSAGIFTDSTKQPCYSAANFSATTTLPKCISKSQDLKMKQSF